jgi:phenylalanyl-tRNA synthetase beta chain
MQISEKWLREWVNPDVDTDKLVASLTMAGLEIDSVSAAASPFTGVIVAEVISAEQHPDADKLRVCQLNTGTDTRQVVCGAPNVAAGQKIPFAEVGAVLGPDLKIKKAKLRGVESQGMICSGEELGLAEKSDGILVLPVDAPLGANVREYLQLDDALIDIDLTPNRGDCLSINGIAREVGVLHNQPVTCPDIPQIAASINDTFPITLDAPDGCPRYLGRIICNIDQDAESPQWMKEKLRRSGIKSIDPVVDVTNYVLMELGQPMHAFDFDKLEGGIHVRFAAKQEKLTLLDGREVEMDDNTLVIADTKKALAIAGVMGGIDSSVQAYTKHIFLESAHFSPTIIAGKARSYGLQTDAAHRFERGVDYNLPRLAMERATQLLLAIVGGQAGPIIEATDSLPPLRTITLRAARIQRILGISLEAGEVETILTGLGLDLDVRDAESWTFSVPSWRFDIAIEEDLVEELARIYGYDNLPVTEALGRSSLKPISEHIVGLNPIRHRLTALGYQEVITYSFVDSKLESLLGAAQKQLLPLANPISQDMNVMRTSLWPGLLLALKHNLYRQQRRGKIFETGLVFTLNNNKIDQKPKISSIIWGEQFPEHWGISGSAVDFFDIKGDAEALMTLTLASTDFTFEAAIHPALQPGQSAQILRQGQPAGWIGALSLKVKQAIDIPYKIYMMELDQTAILPSRLPVYQALSRYPSIRRDLAIIVDASQETGAIRKLIRETAGELLQEIVIFDVYQGQNIGKTKKSLAMGLTFQHPSRTLKDEDINAIIDNCINVLEAQFNAELRM